MTHILALPVEVRLIIWHLYAKSNTIFFPSSPYKCLPYKRQRKKPPFTNFIVGYEQLVALQLVNRTFYHETNRLLLSAAHLFFENTEVMLRILCKCTSDQLTQIKHISIVGAGSWSFDRGGTRCWSSKWVVHVSSHDPFVILSDRGLCLSSLTVHMDFHRMPMNLPADPDDWAEEEFCIYGSWYDLEKLLLRSPGQERATSGAWKELRAVLYFETSAFQDLQDILEDYCVAVDMSDLISELSPAEKSTSWWYNTFPHPWFDTTQGWHNSVLSGTQPDIHLTLRRIDHTLLPQFPGPAQRDFDALAQASLPDGQAIIMMDIKQHTSMSRAYGEPPRSRTMARIEEQYPGRTLADIMAQIPKRHFDDCGWAWPESRTTKDPVGYKCTALTSCWHMNE